MTGNTRWLPAVLVTVGVLALAATARAVGPLNQGEASGVLSGARIPLALLSVVVMIAIASVYAKHRDSGYGVRNRAGTATGLLLLVAAIGTPAGLLFLGRKPRNQPPLPDSPPQQAGDPNNSGRTSTVHAAPAAGGGGHTHFDGWILRILLWLLLAAVIAAVSLAVAGIQRRRRTAGPAPLGAFAMLGTEAEQLAEAVDRGTEALLDGGDPREAVIACYAAMEQALNEEGGGPRAADTPEEFLSRVTAAGLTPAGSARRLTDLFREARFSKHPITETHRDAARGSLGEIGAFLRARAAERASQEATV